jgi:uncharacterized membrane protein YraQ (UPF0718 family)
MYRLSSWPRRGAGQPRLERARRLVRKTLHVPNSERAGRWTGWLLGGGLLAITVAVGLLAVAGRVPTALAGPGPALGALTTIFLGIFIEAVPFVLLGVLVSSALHLFVGEELVARLTPRQPVLAGLTGGLLGLVFPVCECGVVPVCRRLVQKGAPLSLGVALLLAAPVVNPVVIASTWVAFGGDWRIVAWRVGLTLAIAVAIGSIVALHPEPRRLLAAPLAPPPAHHGHSHRGGPGERLRALLWHSGAEFVEMSRYLILGALLAALLQMVVPRPALLALGDWPVAAVLVMIALAVVLSICSTVDAFIALTFASAFGPGALLAFLVFGPMIDIKSTLMFLTIFRRRAVAVIVLLAFQMVLLATLLITYYTP